MSSKSLVIMGVVFLALLSLFMFGKHDTSVDGKDRILDFEADDVEGVTLDRAVGNRPGESPSPQASSSGHPSASPSNGPRQREKLEFEKQDGRWILKQPAYRVGNADMQNLLTTLSDMRQTETVDKSDDKAYGFDDPDAIIDIKTKTGTHKIILGRTTVTDQGYYLKVDSQPKVIVSGMGLAPLIAKNADVWRDKTLLTMEPGTATKWSLVRDNQTLTAEKNKDDGHWQLTQPVSVRADDQAASNVVFQTKNVQPSSFHPEIKPDDPRLKPTITLSVWNAEDKTPDTVVIGTQDPKSKDWYATRSPLQEVIMVPDKSLAALRKNVDDLEDKHVASFDLEKLTDFTLTQGATEVDGKKDGFEWTVTRPAGAKDDMHKLSSVVEQVHDLVWTRKLTGKDASGDMGFTPPAATVVLKKDKDTIATIQFGKSPNKGLEYVRLADHPDTAYVTTANALSVISGAVASLTAPTPKPSVATITISSSPSTAGSGSPAVHASSSPPAVVSASPSAH